MKMESAKLVTRNASSGLGMPYVVSADLNLALKHWVREGVFSAPSGDFVEELRSEFSAKMLGIFSGFQLLSETSLLGGIKSIIGECECPVVSLDRVYAKGDFHLDMSRSVDESMSDVGLWPRADAKPVDSQLDYVAQRLISRGVRSVALVDDVIFEGKGVSYIIQGLARRGIQARLVCAGVGIGEGVDRVASLVDAVRCVHFFETVIDEVCERDFYLGVPFSGRSLAGTENVGLPYVAPFGLPGQWASIPSDEIDAMSRFCIEQSIVLFSEIERVSGKIVRCCDLPRKVFALPRGTERFIDVMLGYV